ncbi:MerR family transcriptional regulator [Streptomyces specialis]|uniref:MerR family transcriptional regulator n=1 Tax=Streptomyces specialis TaxID=498367 RepID=UPI00073E6A10|nr:MerR family transcriptional regulator [Streptomyces specialis]
MRIGELAALAGVTTRTVRHYHHIGLLPESARQPNGYRVYGLRDAVRLARIRRLTELGLGLDEIRDVLADDAGGELDDVLADLDAALARQEEAIRARRARLAELRERGLPPEGPVSAELAELFQEMARMPGPEPAMAAKERELLVLLDGAERPEVRAWLAGLTRSLRGDALARAYDVYARLDQLAGAPVDDPRVGETARAIVAAVPPDVTWGEGVGEEEGTAGASGGSGLAEAFFADLAPAQAEAVRQAMRLLRKDGR